jgi:hypothetical protein
MPKFDFTAEATATNAAFAAEIAKLTVLSSDEVAKFFPAKADKERLAELMKIVRSSASRNQKAADLRQNIETLSETVIRLIEAAV